MRKKPKLPKKKKKLCEDSIIKFISKKRRDLIKKNEIISWQGYIEYEISEVDRWLLEGS